MDQPAITIIELTTTVIKLAIITIISNFNLVKVVVTDFAVNITITALIIAATIYAASVAVAKSIIVTELVEIPAVVVVVVVTVESTLVIG